MYNTPRRDLGLAVRTEVTGSGSENAKNRRQDQVTAAKSAGFTSHLVTKCLIPLLFLWFVLGEPQLQARHARRILNQTISSQPLPH